MERGNTKHGPRLDEEMEKEVRAHLQGSGAGARAEEWREPEPPGEDQPEVTLIPAGDRPGGAPGALTAEEAERRSRLGRHLDLSALPADRDGLRRAAAAHQAPDDVLAELDRLPTGVTFQTVTQVWTALGHDNETQRW
ncbi:MAG TPA: DUF2795 domain-containing protein [Pilimelia sp.]|nr:DUF2795 domain-containing protein [Pilimelia sp.]